MKEKFRQRAAQHSQAEIASPYANVPFTPFILLTNELIIVPTPIAIFVPAYRAFYQRLHATPAFCEMGFGLHFIARQWSDDETRDIIRRRDVELSWKERGIGDFAVGLPLKDLQGTAMRRDLGRTLRIGDHVVRIVDGDEYSNMIGKGDRFWQSVEWAGYAGVRDALITSLYDVISEDTKLPPWQEMVEVRYGVAPEHWGKGLAGKSASAVMLWAARERGVRR